MQYLRCAKFVICHTKHQHNLPAAQIFAGDFLPAPEVHGRRRKETIWQLRRVRKSSTGWENWRVGHISNIFSGFAAASSIHLSQPTVNTAFLQSSIWRNGYNYVLSLEALFSMSLILFFLAGSGIQLVHLCMAVRTDLCCAPRDIQHYFLNLIFFPSYCSFDFENTCF